jgi:hypothetical protein
MVLIKAGRAPIRPSPGSPPSAFRDARPARRHSPAWLRRSPAPPPGRGFFFRARIAAMFSGAWCRPARTQHPDDRGQAPTAPAGSLAGASRVRERLTSRRWARPMRAIRLRAPSAGAAMVAAIANTRRRHNARPTLCPLYPENRQGHSVARRASRSFRPSASPAWPFSADARSLSRRGGRHTGAAIVPAPLPVRRGPRRNRR